MQTNKFILIPVYLVYAIIVAAAVAAGVASLAMAAELAGMAPAGSLKTAVKIVSILIGLTVSWLVLVNWRTSLTKRIITAALVAVGTYIVAVLVALLTVHKSLGL